jgi:CorA-like Mg2+ transporter protein
MIIDCAHYQDGRRRDAGAMPLEEAAARCGQGGFVWLGLFEPGEEELAQVRDTFGLHELAVEDAQNFHMRPKTELYDPDVRLVILRTARYDDAAEEVELGEISVFLAPTFVITVRQGVASGLRGARQRLEQRPELLAAGSTAALWAILDQVVDDYAPVVAGLDATSTRSKPPCSPAPRPRPSGSTRCAARPPTSTVPSTRCWPWSPRSNAPPKRRRCSPTRVTCRTTCCWSMTKSPRSATCSARRWRPTWR